MNGRTAVLVAGIAASLCVLAASCTNSVVFTPGPTNTASFAPPAEGATVHVKLVITAGVQTTVRYSDGIKTRTTEVPGSGAPIEFDAPTPWVVAGTATTALSAGIECKLYVDGELVAHSDSRTDGSMFAACAATQDVLSADGKNPGDTRVRMDASGEDRFWYGWAADGKASGDLNDAGSVTSDRYFASGTARMVVIQMRKSPAPALCTITFGGAIADSRGAVHRGDIATCAATLS